MATFHKPKVFRSTEGCCICKTKSSSSRFTDSAKYEGEFRACFQLEEEREGEICNACVLLVKRWKKLPKNTKRNWSHVVDARAGPGAKNFVKQKKKDENSEEFEKIRRKHFPKKTPRTGGSEEGSMSPPPPPPELRSPAPVSDGQDLSSSSRLQENKIGDFFDSFYWKRDSVCCGVIYRGLLGEVMIDRRHWSPHTCPAHSARHNNNNNNNNNNQDKLGDQFHMTVESLIESELRKLADRKTEVSEEELVKGGEVKGGAGGEQDEGFCDRSSTVTGPRSPAALSDTNLSPNLGLCGEGEGEDTE